MLRRVVLFLWILPLMFMSCGNDPIQSKFGEGTVDPGLFVRDTIRNIRFGQLYTDSVVANTAGSEFMNFMNKRGMKTRLLYQTVQTASNIEHEEARLYLKSKGFRGEDFGTVNCPVYALIQTDSIENNMSEKWLDYTANIDMSRQIGYLKMSSTDTLTDTLFFTDVEIFDNQANNSSVNYAGFLIDLPEDQSDFVKQYGGINSSFGPVLFTTFYDTANNSTKLDTITSGLVYNWFIIDDQTEFNNPDYYYIKTFTPTRLSIIPPMDSIEAAFSGEIANILGAELYIPIDRNESYFEEGLYDGLMVYPPNDSIPFATDNSFDNIAINIALALWNNDSTYVHNSIINDQQQLGNILLQQGIRDESAPDYWLVVPRQFIRFYEALAVPKSGRQPYMILTYYKRPQTRF